MKNLAFVPLLFVLLSTTQAISDTIVDTGPGTTTIGYGFSKTFSQWFAAEFELDQTTFLTRVEGWVKSDGHAGETFSMSIYGDGGETPDFGNRLYTNKVIVSGSDLNNMGGNWEGYDITYGGGLELTAGQYWLAFELRQLNALPPHGDTYTGNLPFNPAFPQANEAWIPYGSTTWIENDGLDLGLRVFGTPVPEPNTLAMLGFGIITLMGISRRKATKR